GPVVEREVDLACDEDLRLLLEAQPSLHAPHPTEAGARVSEVVENLIPPDPEVSETDPVASDPSCFERPLADVQARPPDPAADAPVAVACAAAMARPQRDALVAHFHPAVRLAEALQARPDLPPGARWVAGLQRAA